MTQLHTLLTQCLRPAGDGVHTVSTGHTYKENLHHLLYGSNEAAKVHEQWQQHLAELDSARPILLGVPSDTGGGILRGASWGPLRVREALYQRHENIQLTDIGDVTVIPHLLHDKFVSSETLRSCREALYGTAAAPYAVSPLSIAEQVIAALYRAQPSSRVFVLGGDHSVSYAAVRPYLQHKRELGQRVAVLHFDAHTDLMANRLGIDINFATWAYQILPLLQCTTDLIQIGIRATRYDKRYWQEQLGVQQYWSHEVQEQGPEAIWQAIQQYLHLEGVDELYISFDIDAIDSRYVSATGTPEGNGLLPEQALTMVERLAQICPVTGADLMEVAPYTQAIKTAVEPESTLGVAADLSFALCAALGSA